MVAMMVARRAVLSVRCLADSSVAYLAAWMAAKSVRNLVAPTAE